MSRTTKRQGAGTVWWQHSKGKSYEPRGCPPWAAGYCAPRRRPVLAAVGPPARPADVRAPSHGVGFGSGLGQAGPRGCNRSALSAGKWTASSDLASRGVSNPAGESPHHATSLFNCPGGRASRAMRTSQRADSTPPARMKPTTHRPTIVRRDHSPLWGRLLVSSCRISMKGSIGQGSRALSGSGGPGSSVCVQGSSVLAPGRKKSVALHLSIQVRAFHAERLSGPAHVAPALAVSAPDELPLELFAGHGQPRCIA